MFSMLNKDQENKLSDFKDPFKSDLITRVFFSWNKGYSARASVQFTNGNTEGEQNFKADTFEEVYSQVQSFIKEMK